MTDGDVMHVTDPSDPDDADEAASAEEPEPADGERWEPL
ncbi:hypothetical protein SAMN04488563_2409 [Jiangella alkaliphila]|uniref:Uncharacterized protein n=1 Tax=Jiangella alkaliphila TaxID=419479 RepID=A0A1H2J8V4_9ACTN|nr:hypothetical protein SAMN04488563_2409 [Jiangella alkaliphila]